MARIGGVGCQADRMALEAPEKVHLPEPPARMRPVGWLALTLLLVVCALAVCWAFIAMVGASHAERAGVVSLLGLAATIAASCYAAVAFGRKGRYWRRALILMFVGVVLAGVGWLMAARWDFIV